jgi:hypothetical protein
MLFKLQRNAYLVCNLVFTKMLSLFIRVTVLFLSLLYAIYSQAQLPYSKTYTTHDGLVHPQVTKLFKVVSLDSMGGHSLASPFEKCIC